MKLRWLLLVLLTATINEGMAQNAIGTWSNTGPIQFPINVSGQVNGMGRVCQMKFDPIDSQKMYAVSASGGLFISTNNAQTWAPTPGTETLPTSQCSSVCIDYTNNNTIYLSTGDPDYYYEDYGIWKSTDGGATFNQSNTDIGTRMAVEIIMDPTNHNNLVAATDDGIWRTTNGGATWTETLGGGDFRSMQQKPGSSAVLYAATSSSFYRSLNEGISWTQITNGVVVPPNNGGLRIAVSPADNNVVYIGTTDGYGEILKSTNGGQSFTNIYTSTTQCIVCYDSTITSGSQGDYNFNLTVNPLNANELLLVSHCVWRSIDGGLTWSWRTQWYDQMHTDMHDVKWNPYNNQQRFDANDGGVWMSTDTLATSWAPECNGLAATEIYHAMQSPLIRQMVDIGTQDNGENYFDGIWKCDRGGDWSSTGAFSYLDNGTIFYLEDATRRSLLPLGNETYYNTPFTANNGASIGFPPSVPNMCFIGYDSLWESTNIDANTPSWSFVYPLNQAIMDIAPSHADSNILFLVSISNTFYRSTNALAATPTFTALTTPGNTQFFATIATDKHNSNIVYLTCNNAIYRSVNMGTTWTDITYNLPNSLNIRRVIADDYSTSERIFVCIGNYVYYKDNTSNIWTLIPGLPSIPQITDMMIYNPGNASSLLRLSTYGRGVWECPININLPPTADITVNKQYLCPGDTVQFSKATYGVTTSFSWSFPGGIPATSTADSPVVTYPSPGLYDVTLTVTGPNGTDTVLKSGYITVTYGQGTTLQEGFEETTFPPSIAWTTASVSGNMWQHTNMAGGFGQSAHSMFFDNFDESAGGAHDRIITPKVNLASSDSAYVTFDVAYAYYPGYNDSLVVEVSTDCGKTFIPVYTKDSEVLATAPNNTSNMFVPTATEWRKDTILLNQYTGGTLQLAFDNVGNYGQALYVDNINLVSNTIDTTVDTTNGVNTIANSNKLQAYPNPSSGIVSIKGSGLHGRNATISCYNAVGALISRRSMPLSGGSFNTLLNLSALARGVYELSIQTDSGDKYERQVVLN